MNRILLAIGGLLVGLMALLFAAPAMVDWNRYRGVFEEEASRFLGREVRVGGKVNLRLLPIPFVRFEKVRVADTTANVGRPLFQAEDFTIWLSIGGLLAGALEASEIELRKPVLTLVLDGKGSGSWSSLAGGPRVPGRTPLRVAFNSVRITNGAVSILDAEGEPRGQFDFVNGELSAQALEGPYKIAAAFALAGAPREFRLSTAKPADDGSVRFKGTVRDPSSGVSYSLDGVARDVLEKLEVAGEMTARLPLPAALAGLASGRSSGSEFDVRAELKGNTSGFTLSDLALSFEQAGRPQLATGAARVTWADRTDVALTLKSQWLDLDRIAGGDKGGTPLQLAQALADGVSRVLATEGRTEATLVIDQATLGGDVASDLNATLEHTSGKLQVRSLTALLPGGARLSASGAFGGKPGDQRFDGQVDLRGASMTRFLGWAARDQSVPLPPSDAPFSMVGALTLGNAEIAGRNLALQIGRNALTGDASWRNGPPRQIALDLDGTELDLTPLLEPGMEPAQALRKLIMRIAVGDRADPGTAASSGASSPDAEIKLRVDRLLAGKKVFRDAVAELTLSEGNLAVQQLKLAAADGYAIEIRGEIAELAQPAAKGTLTGLATATRPEGIAALARLLDVPPDLAPSPDSAALAVPLRLAARLHVGGKGPGTNELAVDGTLAQSRVAGTLRLGADAAGWRDRAIDLAMTIDGPDLPRLLGRLPSSGSTLAAAPGQPPVRLDLRGIGKARSGLATLASIESEGASAIYRGRVGVEETGAVGLDGELALNVASLDRGIRLVGLQPRPALTGPLAGTIKVTRSAGRLQLAATRLMLAGSEASGRLTVEPPAGEARPITGDLKVEWASLPGILATLTSGGDAPRGGALPDGGSPWSELPLDLADIDRLASSRVRIAVSRLVLAPGMQVSDARLDALVRPGAIDLRLAESKAVGGRADGMLTLEKAPAGAKLTIDGHLAGARIESFAAPGESSSTASGSLSLSLKASGTALTPRGLIVALGGSGELAIEQARLNRWSPLAITAASDAVLTTRGETSASLLREQLMAAFKASGVALGSKRVALTMSDGVLQTAPLAVSTPRGRITGRAALDLDSLRIDGEWRVEPLNTPQSPGTLPKPELPGVTIVYTGPLKGMSLLEPRLDIDSLEREVAVRRVEREVAELERLRKLDEDHARQEAARIELERRLFEQRRLEALRQSSTGPQGTLLPPATAPQPAGPPLPSAAAADPRAAPPPTAGDDPLQSAPRGPGPLPSDAATPRPAQGAAPARARPSADPFRSLRELSP